MRRYSRADREPRTAPQARLILVNANGADDLVGRDPEHGQGDDRDRVIIDRVAIVLLEQTLLFAEHLRACSA